MMRMDSVRRLIATYPLAKSVDSINDGTVVSDKGRMRSSERSGGSRSSTNGYVFIGTFANSLRTRKEMVVRTKGIKNNWVFGHTTNHRSFLRLLDQEECLQLASSSL